MNIDAHPIVLLLVVITIIFSYKGIQDARLFERYKFNIASILKGEKIRMLSSGFLHADYMHLGFNMYALFLFSDTVLYQEGPFIFLLIYFSSLLAGSIFTLYYHKAQPYYSAVGASGAVSGIVFSAILMFPDMTLIMFPIPIPLPGYIFGVGYLLYSIYGMQKGGGTIGHAAHLGGAIGGFVVTLLFVPELIVQNTLTVFLLAIPILLLVFLQTNNK